MLYNIVEVGNLPSLLLVTGKLRKYNDSAYSTLDALKDIRQRSIFVHIKISEIIGNRHLW